jgi:hydroxypyruvate reductase
VTDVRATLRAVFDLAIARMDPEARVRDALAVIAWEGREVHAIAVGKAACAMARGAASVAARGLVVAPADTGAPWPVMIGSHPVPDLSSVAAGHALIDFVRAVPPDAVLLALVSGGASALAEVPAPGVSLDELVTRVRAVVARGADIFEINRARAELSAIKGGKLAQMCAAPVITLAASDIVNDVGRYVGSGPTVGSWTNMLALPRPHPDLQPFPIDALIDSFRKVDGRGALIRIAGVSDLADAAVFDQRIVPADEIANDITGDVELVAARIAALIDAPGRPLLVLAGEPTVTLPAQPGVGGRAVQLALLVARTLAGRPGWAFLAAGSDGVDGTGPAAGAIVDGDTWGALAARGIDGVAALDRRDAGAALAAIGATIVTGPTGVNHADLMLLWRRPA